MLKKILLTIFLVGILISPLFIRCSKAPPYNPYLIFSDTCLYGGFKPIFPDTFTHYTFIIDSISISSEERFILSNNLEVTIIQSGCSPMYQTFKFYPIEKSFIKETTITCFRRLGNISAEYLAYHQLADAIDNVSVELDQDISLSDNFLMSASHKHKTLIINLTNYE